jgi:hypothetical protein
MGVLVTSAVKLTMLRRAERRQDMPVWPVVGMRVRAQAMLVRESAVHNAES